MHFKRFDGEIASYLRRAGMTQRELANKLGMATNTLSWKRRGEHGRGFTLAEAAKIADLIECNLDDTVMRDYQDAMSEQGGGHADD